MLKDASHLSILQKDPLPEFFLQNPNIGLGLQGTYPFFNLESSKTLQHFISNSKRLEDYTQ
jgi:hypothetical protein